MRNIIAVLKLLAFVIWSFPLALTQLCLLPFIRSSQAGYVLPQFWHRGLCVIFGLKYIVVGAPDDVKDKRTLFVANHLSYFDIFFLGSVLQASFVAKREVAGWPVIGFLSRLQQTAFIDRSRSATSRGRDSLSSMIRDGKSLILFPEATSTDGRDVVPFRSSFFALPFDADIKDQGELLIQPVTLQMIEVDGKKAPLSQDARDIYSWYGDMTLMPHLWAFCKSRGARLNLVFHPARNAVDYEDRKVLAQVCYEDVRSVLLESTSETSDNLQTEKSKHNTSE